MSQPIVPHRLGLRVTVFAAALCSCAGPPVPPPVAFVDSTAFDAIESRAYGVLHGDPESVVIEKLGGGYRIARYVRDSGAANTGTWRADCEGPIVAGEELEALRRVTLASGELIFILTSTANPDILTQRFVLLDLMADCAVRYEDRLRLPVPSEMIAPGPVPGGVSVVRDGTGLRIIDRPKVLRLDGPEGEIGLLLGIRERLIDGSAAAVSVVENNPRFLVPRTVTVAWREALASAQTENKEVTQEEEGGPQTEDPQPETANREPQTENREPQTENRKPQTENRGPQTENRKPQTEQPEAALRHPADEPAAAQDDRSYQPPGPLDLPELGDGENQTSFVIRKNQGGTLVITADGPLVLLEFRHGCYDQPLIPIELWLGEASYTTGTTPELASFARAAGRGHRLENGDRRDLFALRQPDSRLELDVAAHKEPRCIRQVLGFGFHNNGGAPLDSPRESPAAPAADVSS